MFNCEKFFFENEISRGSNSVVFDVKDEIGILTNAVAKCTPNNSNYISFNLQKHSYQFCKKLFKDDVLVPNVLSYFKNKNIGEVLILEKMENLFDIDFIINGEYYYSEVVIRKIAKTIALLHNCSISGYDVEFYWNPEYNKLVLLDIGPLYTFGVDVYEEIRRHWDIEQNNYMGLWNIESQILDSNIAKEIFKKKEVMRQKPESLFNSLDPASTTKHIIDVAQVHALSIFGKLCPEKRNSYLDKFIEEYKKNREIFDIDGCRYINTFRAAVTNGLLKAKAKLYYSLESVLSEESCCAEIKR